ncbi:hypothetical protein MMF93_15260 [Streptomyces tubbatahanensis]|uniref:Uncharacterized protein n=1 Tax=Streptomyces tubbatahanensis TaxID=2923272 RepID=A0ABY3XTB4_9ACTN|nr:hypothetical protein [Streptomyces tubbatahanensis]UNS97692.1 hypothetical protein MMF93_15260 [Streptomyces tubbatahanensis]
METFKAEWDALIAQGQARRDAHTRLNSAAHTGGGGTGPGGADRLATDPAAKKAAAKYVEEQLLPHLRGAGTMGGEPPRDPAPGMLGSERAQPGGTMQLWQAWEGVEHVLGEWSKQVRNLEQRLQGERDALRGAKVLFQTRDGLVRNALLAGQGPLLTDLPGGRPTGLRPLQ